MGNHVPDKAFYKIGEVSVLTKLPASVLRFWESEFSFLRPKKSQGRHRVYDQRAIGVIMEIKRMLYDEGYTITGLKRYWRRRHHVRGVDGVLSSGERVQHIRGELQAILNVLDAKPSTTITPSRSS